nr:helix-turn-helix transcriptional regulator [Neoroseomonas eburnea]
MEAKSEAGNRLPGSKAKPGSLDRARGARVKEAIARVGTQKDAARLSGVAYGTITNYADGGEMKLSNAAALARATGVRLDWLATGEGPMRASDPPREQFHPSQIPAQAGFLPGRGVAEPSPGGRASGGTGIAWQVNPERLARAYEMASERIAGSSVTPTLIMRIALVLYDHLTEVEDAAPPPSSAP